ncbi:MAG: hypothetical protein IPN01_35825 [Deltaproteobacteria bacterium]|nr:hypothetical protein [Deltaproteobacteria bacterium]
MDGAFGHLESASGVAALIVGLEVLRAGALPPVVNFGSLSPSHGQAGPLPVQISSAVTHLTPGAGPARLGVHNFGYGGVNAHLVLEAPPTQTSTPTPGPALLVLSAPRASQLHALATALGAALNAQPDLNLHDVAFTLRAGRRAFEHRLALVVHDLAEAAARLTKHSAEAPAGELGRVEAPTGQLAAGDLHALARAFCRGDSLPAPAPARRVPLPTLPLFGPGSGAGSHWAATAPAGPGAPRQDGQGWSMDRRWSSADPLMRDHRVRGLPTLPAAAPVRLGAP